MRKLSFYLAVLLVFGFSLPSTAKDALEFKGFLAPELKLNLSSPFGYSESKNDLFRMEIISHLSESAGLVLTPNVRMLTSSNSISYEYDLREAYVDLYSKLCDVRIGKQIISWGASKENNAVDVLNPSDYRDPSKKKIDRKIGVLALKSDFYIKDCILEAVFVPFADRTVFPSNTSEWAQGDTTVLDATPLPAFKLSDSELGLRFSKTILSKVDVAVSYFNGWEDMPSIKAADLFLQNFQFRKIQMIGFDFDGGIGSVGINTEIAGFITQDTAKSDLCLKNPYLQWILGLEYDFPLGITAGLQYSQEFQSGTGAEKDGIPGVYTPVSGLGMDLGFFTTQAIGLGLEKKFGEGDSSAFELFAFCSIDPDNEGYLSSPNLRLSQSEGVNIYVGTNIYGGANGSILGNYSDNSNLYLKVKYSF